MLFYRPHTLDHISKKALEMGLFSISCVADVWQNFYKKKRHPVEVPFFRLFIKERITCSLSGCGDCFLALQCLDLGIELGNLLVTCLLLCLSLRKQSGFLLFGFRLGFCLFLCLLG